MPFILLILSALITFSKSSDWKCLSFSNVPANKVTFRDGALKISVKESASPLLKVFRQRQMVQSVTVKGRVSGEWQLPANESWNSSPDDALLRVGLIENGNRRLNALEKMAAPAWVKEIESQSEGVADGIGKIHCFHLVPETKWIGETRENHDNPIFIETAQSAPSEDGSFEMVIRLGTPIDTVGLWLLSDGDDSQGAFCVEIECLEIEVARQ